MNYPFGRTYKDLNPFPIVTKATHEGHTYVIENCLNAFTDIKTLKLIEEFEKSRGVKYREELSKVLAKSIIKFEIIPNRTKQKIMSTPLEESTDTIKIQGGNPFTFYWSDQKVAEVTRIISDIKDKSELWSSDYVAELNIIEDFKKVEQLKLLKNYLNPVKEGGDIVVNAQKLDEVMVFLLNKT